MKSSDGLVSIIIPVFNNSKGLRRTLNAIFKQSYKNPFEVIVIDNGSSDFPGKVVEDFENVRYLEETKYLNSPYSARNRGLEVAKGNIIVFLDATCAPVENWLSEGIKALEDSDLVGGEVSFYTNPSSTLAEIYDSLFNVRMKESIENRKVAKAGNLFVYKEVLDNTGYFPEGLRSGGDVRWTALANRMGYSISYSRNAEVVIIPKKIGGLIRKQFRVGKGQPKIWKETGNLKSNLLKKVLLCWLPPNPIELRKKTIVSDKKYIQSKFLPLFFLGWFLRIVNGTGNMTGFILKQKEEI